ncbi:MAG TPA: hypothetical protein VK151_04010 [Fluviicola sp.]|nr:hypothetical protein [Fluviicola sp.]
MKAITFFLLVAVVLPISAQDYDYLQNGIKPKYTGKWIYEGKTAPEGFKRDTLTVARLNRFGQRVPVVDTAYTFPNDSINQKDSNGKKQGHWIIFGKDRPESGIPAEGKVEEGYYVDDKKEGVWIKYHDDGITPKLKGEYHNNRPVGTYYRSRNGGWEIGTFEKNIYRDSLIRGQSNHREYEAFYNENGKEEGRVNYYYPNGQLEFTFTAKNGVPTGQAKRYYNNGDLKELIDYAEDGSVINTKQFDAVHPLASEMVAEKKYPPAVGDHPRTRNIQWKPDGYNKVYNEDNEIWQDGIFKEGKLCDGKVYEYDSDGILMKVSVYKSGGYHSEGQK